MAQARPEDRRALAIGRPDAGRQVEGREIAQAARPGDALGTNAVNTRIRFRVTGGLTTANAFFFFDNVVISDGGGALTAGHWELRVDESSAVTTGSDINAIGLRVDDGDETAAGTEIPAYIDSQNEYGVNPPASGQVGRSTTNYPYFTSGCTAVQNDFDYDSNQTDNVGYPDEGTR